jgi:hypothetical protein
LTATRIPPEIVGAPMVPDLYRLAVEAARPGGLYLEFGVGSGRSLRALRRLIPAEITLYGFDSFLGLPEAWNGLPVGTFATGYRVNLPNTPLVVGRFQETVPRFAEEHRGERVSLMHVDCDLYSSTKAVLDGLREAIVPGTVIIFDELFGTASAEDGEYRALIESGLSFEALGRWDVWRAVVRVK